MNDMSLVCLKEKHGFAFDFPLSVHLLRRVLRNPHLGLPSTDRRDLVYLIGRLAAGGDLGSSVHTYKAVHTLRDTWYSIPGPLRMGFCTWYVYGGSIFCIDAFKYTVWVRRSVYLVGVCVGRSPTGF